MLPILFINWNLFSQVVTSIFSLVNINKLTIIVIVSTQKMHIFHAFCTSMLQALCLPCFWFWLLNSLSRWQKFSANTICKSLWTLSVFIIVSVSAGITMEHVSLKDLKILQLHRFGIFVDRQAMILRRTSLCVSEILLLPNSCKQLWQEDFLYIVFCNTMQYPVDIFDENSDHFHHSNLKYFCNQSIFYFLRFKW